MLPPDAARATGAAVALVRSFGLPVAGVDVLQSSNRLTLRLRPAETVARVALAEPGAGELEVALARRLGDLGAPVGRLDPRVPPRVHHRDGFAVSLWRHHPPAPPAAPSERAAALERLHAGLRIVDVEVPPVAERIGAAHRVVADPERSPALSADGRRLLVTTLETVGRRVAAAGPGQPLHGEPHPGNVLDTAEGPLFIDLETCCRGPVEVDVAQLQGGADRHYRGADAALVEDCRVLSLALATAWRWDRHDQLPDGPRLGGLWLDQLREAVER